MNFIRASLTDLDKHNLDVLIAMNVIAIWKHSTAIRSLYPDILAFERSLFCAAAGEYAMALPERCSRWMAPLVNTTMH